MDYLPGKFVWFEFVSNDITKARAFYEPLFNWHIEAMPMGQQTYHMIHNGNEGIGGFVTAQPGARNHWNSYMSVLDVDKSYAAALAVGAKPLLPPTDFDPVGRGAAFIDPTGAAMSLWKSAQGGDRPDPEQIAVGDWCWNELWTPDVKKALAFYEKVFGYQHDAMDMGPQGTYYVLKTGDKRRGGVTRSSQPSAPPMWLPYVHVADCDATAAQAKKLGAQSIIVPPTDIPGVGRFAILIDSLGAAIAVLKPLPPTAS